ncbi:universal stress protein [Xanthomarina sp. F1114]|uniref:universal stress protein n=1 Tax=Xanthomarina sp. F1114 TaxID=2996019 RepID=UPI00225DF0CE|nr:universal stress protein [Xanthomarina sp. F1114]MCX7546987.1 universal stress protein [Xanthomarina sp. F1114]
MRKRFILLIDFSEYSRNLIKYAYEWSIEANARILLLHQSNALVPTLADSETKEQIIQQTNNDALRELKTLAQSIIPNTANFSYSVSENHFQISLSKLLSEPFDNLVFVGLKGTGMFKKLFLGSVALEIIRNTENIVVAMPKEIDSYTHEKIYIAVNEKKPLNIIELNNFLRFIDSENTHITFFYLAYPDEETKQIENQLRELSEKFANRFNTDFAIYEGKNRLEDIKKVINNKIDEILIVQRGSRFLTDQIFRRFLINDLVHEGQTPLIVLP